MSRRNGHTESVGGLRSLFNGKGDEHGTRQKAVEALEAEYPLVAEALAGIEKSGDQAELPPGTITFWLDGPIMKFTYSVKALFVTHYGTVADVTNPWGSVNSALLTGEVSRKRHSEHQTTIEKLDKEGKIY
ncbi:MAG: hypothetical protein [Circular genetic element sp.]|nr:MAG: hypothetical protein [Circular genetic element sp.]